jgi:phage terminase large subunit-like protein
MTAAAQVEAVSGGARFAAFCSQYVRQTKGRWASRPLNLEDWQLAFWEEALELDPETGRRTYTEVGLGLPTKNGKSTQASAAGLYFLTADGEAEPEVIVAAAARAQARIVFGQSRSMANASPLLLDHLRVLQHTIEVPRTNGIMRMVSADAALQHGPNPSANIIDEIHAHKNRDLYTALTKSGAAREQPFTLWITTAGGTGEGLLGELYGQMFTGTGQLELRPGLTIYRDRENGILIYWYGAAQDDDVEDPELWRRVNPASWMGDLVYLRRQFANMSARGALLEWRMYHLNQFVDRVAEWMPLTAWKACLDTTTQAGWAHELQAELPVGLGVYKTPDGSQAAIVIAQAQAPRSTFAEEAGPLMVVRAEHFGPERATGQASPIAIRNRLAELRAVYPAPMARDPKTKVPLLGPAIAYASYNLEESAAILASEGLNMVKFPLVAGTMGPASTRTHELIATGRLKHNGDAILAEHIARTDALLTDRGMQIVPGKAPHYNPSAVALVAAVAMAVQEAPTPYIARPRTGVGF